MSSRFRFSENIRTIVSVAAIVLALMCQSSAAGPTSVSGAISNISSGPAGLYLKISTGLPDTCQGTPYGWMLVKQEDTTMISVVLTMFTLKKSLTVYVNTYAGTGYCTVNQIDPVE